MVLPHGQVTDGRHHFITWAWYPLARLIVEVNVVMIILFFHTSSMTSLRIVLFCSLFYVISHFICLHYIISLNFHFRYQLLQSSLNSLLLIMFKTLLCKP